MRATIVVVVIIIAPVVNVVVVVVQLVFVDQIEMCRPCLLFNFLSYQAKPE